MDQTLSKEQIIELLSNFVRGEITEEEDRYIVNSKYRSNEIVLFILKTELETISTRLSELNVSDETALYGDNNYEIIVREESTVPFRRFREDKIEVNNEDNGVTYELSPASTEYFIWLLAEITQKMSPKDIGYGYIPSHRLENLLNENKEASLIKFIQFSSFRILTLKIKSDKQIPLSHYSKLTHAFVFHLGFNLDIALVPQRLLEEIARRGRITRMRRSNPEEIDPPRRIYNEDIVQHYLLAVSTDSPVIEYLSYYHVLEHFYETVYNEDLIESIRTTITNPGFSYKRKKDIGQLIATIKKSLQFRSETITFSEENALRLCLSKYVSLSELQDKLTNYDETLLDYYKNNKVSFSSGSEVDICNDNDESIIKALTKRIYKTRNALVHSKDGDKSKYTPFKDDRILVREVPLMRFISEMVILSESNVQ